MSSVLSSPNKNLKRWTDQCYSPQTDQYYSSVLQLSFIQKVKENTSMRHEDMLIQKMKREERPGLILGPLIICFFLLSLAQVYINWARQECCLFHLRSSLCSSDLLLFYFPELFPSLSFSHHHFGLLFPILTTELKSSLML